jgi:tetratricopeptide (TPR) repeat protein
MLNISREENISKAKDALGRAYNENKISFYIPLRLSHLYLYSKDEKAVDFAQIALERNPLWTPIKADLSLALAYTGKGNADEIDILARDSLNFTATEEEYRAMHYITPSEKDSIAYTALGFAHIKEDKAKTYFTKALELDKENAFAYLGLSEIAKLRKDLLSEVEYLYSAININPCIEEAYNEYFAIAPLIKIETDLGRMSLKAGTALEIRYSIVRNTNLLDKIIAGVEVDGSIVEESEVKSNARVAYIKVPDKGPFVIFIKGIDKNGKEIVRVRSVPLNPE